MNAKSPAVRLVWLEDAYGRQGCPTCGGHPSRLVYVDPDTEAETGETLPASGCPECARAIVRELRIIRRAGDALP